MSCTLNKFTTYGVSRVIHDNSSGSYYATLSKPPTSCPDQAFASKKAEVKVVEGMAPQLSFDLAKGHAVIVVPTTAYIEEVGSSGFSFGLGFFTVLAAAVLLGLYFIFRRSTPALAGNTGTGRSYGGGYSPNPSGPSNNGGGGTTVINNNSGNDGLLTGVMIGSMMSNNRSERIIEHDTTIIERESSSKSDDSYSSDDSSSSSSDSDSSSSYSSDSDSGSSFSSDSGSSDSGSSFSSDS
jgi:hypothetical protein